jgi:tetratricopeptide (TPR) repeat protein
MLLRRTRRPACSSIGRLLFVVRPLYAADPDGITGERCVRLLRFLSWQLWQFDGDLFPLSLVLRFSSELVRRNLGSAYEWTNYSALLQNAGDWQKALNCAQMATRIDPSYSSGWSGMGECFLAVGDLERGRQCLEKAAALLADPGDRTLNDWPSRGG